MKLLVRRLFSPKRNIPRGAEFFFVCELSRKTNLGKAKKNSAPRGIFRLVGNSLDTGSAFCAIVRKHFLFHLFLQVLKCLQMP